MKIRIYTDGACSGNPGPGGWASVLLLPKNIEEISGFDWDTTNNRMELKAAVEALRLAIKLGYDKIDVYSDSAYVVNAVRKGFLKKWLHNGWKTTTMSDVKNKDLWIQILKLFDKGDDINFIKVKGHAGNPHNCRCDELAKREIERRRDQT